MASETEEEAEVSEDHLTESSNRLLLAAANTLDEDTLDLDVGLGPDDAHRIVKRRPFASVEQVRRLLAPAQVRLLLDYAKRNGVRTAPGTVDGGAWDGSAGDHSVDAGYDATPFLPVRDAGGQ